MSIHLALKKSLVFIMEWNCVYQAESDEAARQPCLIAAMPVKQQAILQRISVAPP